MAEVFVLVRSVGQEGRGRQGIPRGGRGLRLEDLRAQDLQRQAGPCRHPKPELRLFAQTRKGYQYISVAETKLENPKHQ